MEEDEKILKLLTETKGNLVSKLNAIGIENMSQKNLQIIASLNSTLSLHINTLKNENK